jgi:hypothetical protein
MLTIREIEIVEKYTHLARKDQMMALCCACGHKYHVYSKWESFLHWLTCRVGREFVQAVKHNFIITRKK